jgi:hypothetical protein
VSSGKFLSSNDGTDAAETDRRKEHPMMKKIALAALAVVTLATATVSSNTQAEAKNNNGDAFLAGAIIGGAAGLIAGHGYRPHRDDGYRPHRDYGYRPHRDYDYRPVRAPSRTVCEVREQFNKWGEYVGARRVCWKERSRY